MIIAAAVLGGMFADKADACTGISDTVFPDQKASD